VLGTFHLVRNCEIFDQLVIAALQDRPQFQLERLRVSGFDSAPKAERTPPNFSIGIFSHHGLKCDLDGFDAKLHILIPALIDRLG
jgi:hypothetical protein